MCPLVCAACSGDSDVTRPNPDPVPGDPNLSDRPLDPPLFQPDVTYIDAPGENTETIYGLTDITQDPNFRETQVIESCIDLQMALELYAADNDGVYPCNLASVNAAGNTVIDLLPGGTLMRNPYSLARSNPVDGAGANRGEIGYSSFTTVAGPCTGYTITGMGKHAEIVTLVKPVQD
jgi:hypothetical protein